MPVDPGALETRVPELQTPVKTGQERTALARHLKARVSDQDDIPVMLIDEATN
jgi:hypothetical protein